MIVELRRIGFSLKEIHELQIDQARYILQREVEINNKKNAMKKLDMAECINVAYVASQPGQKGRVNRGIKQYEKWRTKLIKLINPAFQETTVWDSIKKSTRF